jgi:EAL domain-containing protein (putative c-di-GMP-specific phosphodiesterase class I)
MKKVAHFTAKHQLGDLSALVQHELQHPLTHLQGAIQLLSTGQFGDLSHEGEQLLRTAMLSLDRLTRLANAVEAQPTALAALISPEQMRLTRLKQDLPAAIDNQDIYLVYQPIVCVQTKTIIGVEALARWQHPIHGHISPTVFIPLAEESGLIHQLGKNLILKACQQLRTWQDEFPACQALTMSVNLSALQLSQLDLSDYIAQVLETTGVHPNNLKLEITESFFLDNSEVAAIVLKKLKKLDIQLYLDDFGTGYSSLSRLISLPLSTLKIDKSFVANKNWEILELILALSQKLNLNVIVEGVETDKESAVLKDMGFQYMQGYLFSHPLTVEAASERLKTALKSNPNGQSSDDLPQMPLAS